MIVLSDVERAALTLPPKAHGVAGVPPLDLVSPPRLPSLEIPIRIELGTIHAPEATWEQLRVGDRLPIPTPAQGFAILADHYRLGTGDICRVGNHLAVQIRQWGASPDEAEERGGPS